MPWKNTMATDHTDGEPPNRGNTIFVNMGCTANNRAALRKIAAVKTGISRAEELLVLTDVASSSLTDMRGLLCSLVPGTYLLQSDAIAQASHCPIFELDDCL